MAIYIGTKRIDGGGSSDPSTIKLATNYDASIQMYSIPVFCSSTDSNLISPNYIHEYDNSLKIIPHFGSGSYISNIDNYTLNDPENMFNGSYPGIEIYNGGGARIISSSAPALGNTWFSMEPNWNGGNIVCKLWDGYRNDASSNKGSWYYQDTNVGYIYPTIDTSFNSYTNTGYYLLLYPNTILNLTNATINSGYINVAYRGPGVSNIIVRETANFSGIIGNSYTILYGPNFEENAAKGSAGDPSTIVCYSFLTIPDSKIVLVNAAQYKEA